MRKFDPIFDPKGCPTSGVFDCSKLLEFTDNSPPASHNLSTLGGDLTTCHAPWVGNLNFQKVKSPPSLQHSPGGG